MHYHNKRRIADLRSDAPYEFGAPGETYKMKTKRESREARASAYADQCQDTKRLSVAIADELLRRLQLAPRA